MKNYQQDNLLLLKKLKSQQSKLVEQSLKLANLQLEKINQELLQIMSNMTNNRLKKKEFMRDSYAKMRKAILRSDDFNKFSYLIKRYDLKLEELQTQKEEVSARRIEVQEHIVQLQKQLQTLIVKQEKYSFLLS